MYSKKKNFLNKINEKYESFKEDILKVNLGDNLCDNLSENNKRSFFKYQEFLYNYMKDLNDFSNKGNVIDNRGLLIYHGLGSGKTTSGILLSESCRNYNLNEEEEHYDTKKMYSRKVILMIPANLFFDPWVKEISSKCYSNCEIRDEINNILENNKKLSEKKLKDMIINKLKEYDFHVINYNAYTLSGGYREKLLDIPNRKITSDRYTNKYSESVNPFDDSVIIIDECHNLVNMITNKIKSGEKVELYDDLFNSENSRLLLLSGTPIVNDIFEIGVISNIIRGKIKDNKNIKFEDNYSIFNSKFLDDDESNIKNKKMLMRRLNGIISYNKGINENVFAKEINENVYIPFDVNQEEGYLLAEKLSIELSNKVDKKEISDLYRRKASNVILPNYLFDNKLLKTKKLKKNNKLIDMNAIDNKKRLLDITITKEIEKNVINILDNDDKPLNIDNDLHKISKKVYNIIKKIKESNGPVLVYSNFEGLYGIRFIEEALKQNNYESYKKNKNTENMNGTYMKWTGKDRNNDYKNIFNSYENKNGELIKVFLMTSSGKEGINLMGVRQIHIMEPWWNNTLLKQVIGRGIRICSHNHIEKNDFIDLRIKKELRILNTRLVNVFQYYGFLDLREKNKNKNIVKNEMKMRSIDFLMKKVADKKEKLGNQMLDLLKQISIDCNINYERNNENIYCYIDNNHNDYFDSWNIEDDEIKMTKKRYNIITLNNIKYVKDQFHNIYMIKNSKTINLNNLDNDIIKIGKLLNNKIQYDNNYYKNEEIQNIKNNKIIKNTLKKICMKNKININQDVDYIGIYDKNLILTMKTFNIVNLYTDQNNLKIEKIKKYDNKFIIKRENEKLTNNILIINNYNENFEKIINNTFTPEYIIVLNISDTEIFTFNEVKKYSKYNTLVISNKKYKNNLYKMIKELDINIDNKLKLIKDLERMNIESYEKLEKYLKNENKLDDIFTMLKIKLNIKDDLKYDIKNFNECIKMLLKDIKKSNEYKNIPKKFKKSKMKKQELCETIEKINS